MFLFSRLGWGLNPRVVSVLIWRGENLFQPRLLNQYIRKKGNPQPLIRRNYIKARENGGRHKFPLLVFDANGIDLIREIVYNMSSSKDWVVPSLFLLVKFPRKTNGKENRTSYCLFDNVICSCVWSIKNPSIHPWKRNLEG